MAVGANHHLLRLAVAAETSSRPVPDCVADGRLLPTDTFAWPDDSGTTGAENLNYFVVATFFKILKTQCYLFLTQL